MSCMILLWNISHYSCLCIQRRGLLTLKQETIFYYSASSIQNLFWKSDLHDMRLIHRTGQRTENYESSLLFLTLSICSVCLWFSGFLSVLYTSRRKKLTHLYCYNRLTYILYVINFLLYWLCSKAIVNTCMDVATNT